MYMGRPGIYGEPHREGGAKLSAAATHVVVGFGMGYDDSLPKNTGYRWASPTGTG